MRATGYRDKAKFTRLARYNQELTRDEDGEFDMSDEEIRRIVRILWKNSKSLKRRYVDVLTNFDWS